MTKLYTPNQIILGPLLGGPLGIAILCMAAFFIVEGSKLSYRLLRIHYDF